jgi:hypothetical protein
MSAASIIVDGSGRLPAAYAGTTFQPLLVRKRLAVIIKLLRLGRRAATCRQPILSIARCPHQPHRADTTKRCDIKSLQSLAIAASPLHAGAQRF